MRYIFTSVFLCVALASFGQKAVSLESMLYRAITQENASIGSDHTETTEITFDNYKNYEISAELLLERYPDLRQYVIQDSILQLRSNLYLKGWINDDNAGIRADTRLTFKNLWFKGLDINLKLFSPSTPDEQFKGSRMKWDNCHMDSVIITKSNMNLAFQRSKIESVNSFYPSVNPEYLFFGENEIGRLDLRSFQTDDVFVEYNKISSFYMNHYTSGYLRILGNHFEPSEKYWSARMRGTNRSYTQNDSSTYHRDNVFKDFAFMLANNVGEVKSFLFIEKNYFHSPDGNDLWLIAPHTSRLFFNDNILEGFTNLSPNPGIELEIANNQFGEVTIHRLVIPETPQHPVLIDWDQFENKIILRDGWNAPVYKAENQLELADERAFHMYVNQFQKLLAVYKNSGNMDDANKVLLKIKSILLKRYEYIYRTNGGTTNYFRLKLNQLLDAYTRHGTDPAQAMTASVYIILIFATIYFFFPSEWDTTTKPVMMANLKALWNDKNQRKPRTFFSLLGTVSLSMLNAITLSVNSFITLGFGRIPTKGAAKYICIFQGFMGWFLLSIFIVALINQVMF